MKLGNPGRNRSAADLRALLIRRALQLGRKNALFGPHILARRTQRRLLRGNVGIVLQSLRDQRIELLGSEQCPPLPRQIAAERKALRLTATDRGGLGGAGQGVGGKPWRLRRCRCVIVRTHRAAGQQRRQATPPTTSRRWLGARAG